MVYIDKEACKGCGICISVCPKNILTFTKDLNQKGIPYPKIIDEDKCIQCGICITVCPKKAVETKA